MNITQLLEDDGFSCKKKAKTYGGTYGSPCPWCGGDDRFRSFPNNDYGGNWLCQKCEKTGTAITYLIERRGMNYNEARSYLGLSSKRQTGSLRKENTDNLDQLQPKEKDDLPIEQWQSGVDTIIKGADKVLWNLNPQVISWLNDRGLHDDTLKKFKLGFFYQDQWHKREDLGLSSIYKENGEPKKLWIPRGLIIPYIFNEKIIRLRVRPFESETDLKYYLLEGSSNQPMTIGSANPVVIVESELDAMLIHQEAGDLITVIALGSSQIRPDQASIKLLKQAEVILIALDSDDAGVNSFEWWQESFPQSIFWPVPDGKDPSEAWQKGVNIRDWIEAGLSYENNDHQSIIVLISGFSLLKFSDYL